LISVNIKLAQGLQNLAFGWRYTGSTCNSPMLNQPKSAMGAPQRELEPQFSLQRGQQIIRTKAYRQSVSPYCATNIISQLMFAFTGRNSFISMKASGNTLKIQKPPATLIYACIYQ
jgi:hypothetical protein